MTKYKKIFTKSFWLTLEALPIVVPAIIAVFGASAIVFLLLGSFYTIPVWLTGGLLATLTTIVIVKHYPKEEGLKKYRKMCNLLIIVGVLLWGGFNVFYTSQHVITNRDPALYASGGIWLVDHNNLNIPRINTFGNISELSRDGGAGFASLHKSDNHYQVQGLHLLDAFIGLAGRLTSKAIALHINVLFGMSALLAIYAFGRALIKRTWWAVVGTAVMAVSMPMIYFARETYSEPLAATFTFGGLALVWLAVKTKRLAIWFLAGLVLAAGTMTRIDGYLTIIAVIAFLAIMLGLSLPKERARVIKQSVALSAGMLITGLLGWLYVSRLSQSYYKSLTSKVHLELIGIILIILIGLLFIWLSWKTTILSYVDKLTISWRSIFAATAVVAVAILLATRPFLLSGHYATGNISGNRTFAEISTQWVAWYIGGCMAVLGVVGLAMAVHRVFRRFDPFVVCSLLVVIVTSLLYLIKPSIVADQIWASRRLLPVVLPGIAMFGVYAIDWLSGQYLKNLQWGYALAALVSGALVLSPLLTSRPVLLLRPYTQLSTINSVCTSLPKNAAVLWLASARVTMIQPTRGVCGVQADGYGPLHDRTFKSVKPSQHTLAQAAKHAKKLGKIAVVGVFSDQMHYLPNGAESTLTKVIDYHYEDLEQTYTTPPQTTTTYSGTILMGIIKTDGSIAPLPAQ